MPMVKNYSIGDVEEVSAVGKALSSPVRIEILKLLGEKGMIIAEIAKKVGIPVSSTAFHMKILEDAGLVWIENHPGTRGTAKFCSRNVDYLSLNFVTLNSQVAETYSEEMPVGAFTDCEIFPTCGIYTLQGVIGMEDKVDSFYFPERIHAGLLWSSAGYVEYRFSNRIPEKRKAKKLLFRLELCSEAPGYREDWKSDITVWINGVDCGTWTAPGDFGSRRGVLAPACCISGSSQYGLLTTWEVHMDGSYINGRKVSDVRIDDLKIMEQSFVRVRIGNKPGARHVGGFSIFGKNFGDYNQDLILNVEY